MKRQLATLVLLASTTPLAAQWLTLATPGIPRTVDGEPDLSAPVPRSADGHPDLAGLWVLVGVSGDMLDPSKAHEWARTLMTERERRFFDDSPEYQCLPHGPAHLTRERQMQRIVQSSTVTAILHHDLTYRQIFMDGRTLEPNPHPTWMGYSVGRWEDGALIVETTDIDYPYFNRVGVAQSEGVETFERFTVTDGGRRLDYELTITDPATLTEPVSWNTYFASDRGDVIRLYECNVERYVER